MKRLLLGGGSCGSCITNGRRLAVVFPTSSSLSVSFSSSWNSISGRQQLVACHNYNQQQQQQLLRDTSSQQQRRHYQLHQHGPGLDAIFQPSSLSLVSSSVLATRNFPSSVLSKRFRNNNNNKCNSSNNFSTSSSWTSPRSFLVVENNNVTRISSSCYYYYKQFHQQRPRYHYFLFSTSTLAFNHTNNSINNNRAGSYRSVSGRSSRSSFISSNNDGTDENDRHSTIILFRRNPEFTLLRTGKLRF